ncbi:MAG: undecaprenyldiphospho-muramoylpentapeptide beta-N-acetylglucosaminyltransferase [Pseudomonadota bacterium]|jgi:UDP-N-acetylglucosamine--N-acetylmuramyl-(pentapeptide) pyrophosphoryl-undecaprenol N-acetylglucosamine transferase
MPSVVLAAGGTGGHLFPAVSLAEELGRRGYAVDLMTDMRGHQYGSDFPARATYRLPAATLGGRSPIAFAKTSWTLLKGLREARRLLREIRPGAVVGFGGYPSFAPLLGASMLKIPTILHEQNAVLGRANRMLAGRVDCIATSFESVSLVPDGAAGKVHFVGNPVRDAVIRAAAAPYVPAEAEGTFSLLVFGGSQGARFFSDCIPAAVKLMYEEDRRRLRIVQQCRPEDIERVGQVYAELGVDAELSSFFADLPEIMASSHLVIGRAGASTVAELTVLGRPAVLVPLPHALDNDQLQNATKLAESGGGWCIPEKDLPPEYVAEMLAGFMSHPDMLVAAAEAARQQGRPDAVSRFADVVVGMIQSRPG